MMIKMLITSALSGVFAVGGVFGASFLKGPSDVEMSDDAAANTNAHSDELAANHEDPSHDETDGGHGDGEVVTESIFDTDYFPMRFSRPFVIPITDGWRTQALVVLELNIELHGSTVDGNLGLEQRLRDRIMTALIQMSHDGEFSVSITDPALRDKVREVVKVATESLVPEEIGKILIVEMLRRNV